MKAQAQAKNEQMCISVDAKTRATIERLADDNGWSLSETVRRAVARLDFHLSEGEKGKDAQTRLGE